MPIRREHRHFYGKAWRNFRLQLITAAGGEICSRCGIELSGYINGAHLDHNPKNKYSVVLMCPSCHARHDARHRIAIMRRRRATDTGQLWLMPEFEWAPYAAWEIPGPVFDRLAQMKIFEHPSYAEVTY